MTAHHQAGSAHARGGPDEPPEQTSDDGPTGWGDDLREVAEADTDEWYLSERPPHHG